METDANALKMDSGYLDPPTQRVPTDLFEPEVGRSLGHVKQYNVTGQLGEGGMGWVYRAYDQVLRRDVAVKVMKPGVPELERRRFYYEAIYGARLLHPGITRVFDLEWNPDENVAWFAMEFLPGRDLEQLKDRAGPRGIPYRLIFGSLFQVLGALQYTHDCRIVHRDIKPANIFVSKDPNTRFMTTKLLDFGLALDLEEENPEPENHVCGDPRYMAPEQTHITRNIDGRADLYAVGMTLFEIVTGSHPYEELLDGHPRDMLQAHRELPLPSLAARLPSNVPKAVAMGLERVVQCACAKAPERRFAKANDMKAALQTIVNDAKVSTVSTGTGAGG